VYHFGFWRFYTKIIKAAKKNMTPGAQWMQANQALFHQVGKIVDYHYPGIRQKAEKIPAQKRLFNLWTLVAININAPCYPHIDKQDY